MPEAAVCSVELHHARARDPMHVRVAVARRHAAADQMRVTVQEMARLMPVDPLAQPLPTDVRGVVGIVVDPERRAVAHQHVGRRQATRQLAAPLFCVRW